MDKKRILVVDDERELVEMRSAIEAFCCDFSWEAFAEAAGC